MVPSQERVERHSEGLGDPDELGGVGDAGPALQPPDRLPGHAGPVGEHPLSQPRALAQLEEPEPERAVRAELRVPALARQTTRERGRERRLGGTYSYRCE
jgi:hypothetical protein